MLEHVVPDTSCFSGIVWMVPGTITKDGARHHHPQGHMVIDGACPKSERSKGSPENAT